MSNKFGIPTSKVTKWIADIHEDILILTKDKPEMFRKEGKGLKHTLHFKYYDSHTAPTYWLNTSPRENERLSSYFLNTKLGISSFWVIEVQHEFVDGENNIEVYLRGGFPNQYRSLLIDTAMFFGHISLIETHTDYDYQIDDKLLSIYKSEKI